jgi:methionyl-tRNA formyltransferase
VFAGTPGFAVVALHRLIGAGFAPVAALTQPDRRAGRGREMHASPVKQAAIAAAINVYQPHTLKEPEVVRWLLELRPDLMIVVAYGLILPREILQIPTHGCWNIHASLLPRWRGAAPIARAIEAGDEHSGVCIMQMDAGLDTQNA